MSADFTPTMGTYIGLRPFRFWCQKVLPLVYDDSLSYYELLNKVVDYLNKCMEDIETLHEDVDDLHDAYVQLQNYVNNYFDNLDVQEEINNKLDVMAEDGTLSALIQPLFDTYTEEINEIVGSQQNTIATLVNRMDEFSRLAEGSTTGDAELADIRVGADGVTYPNAGDAVRTQCANLNKAVDAIVGGKSLLLGNWVSGYSNVSTGVIDSSFTYRVTHANWLEYPFDVTIHINSGYQYNAFDDSFNLITNTTPNDVVVTAGTKFRVNIRKHPEDTSIVADPEVFGSQISVINRFDILSDEIDSLFDAELIATNTDLDTVTNGGIYRGSPSRIYTNSPFSDGDSFYLTVLGTPTGYLYQQAFRYIGAGAHADYFKLCVRYKAVGGEWSDWITAYNYLDIKELLTLTLRSFATLANGTDLNTVKTMGIYPMGYSSSYTNCPIPSNNRRTLYVTNNSNNATVNQILINNDTGDIYIRVYIPANDTWGTWHNKAKENKDEILYRPTNLDTHSHTIAHRGVPHFAPDGTKPSFVMAKQMGLLIAEGDIRFTSDGVPVVFHNSSYTVGGVTHTISQETYEQLMEYDIGAAFGPEYTGTYALTLSEFLDLCNNLGLIPAIEFKTGTAQQVEDCLNIIDAKRCKVFNYKASVANLKTIIDHDNYASVRVGADDYSATLLSNLNEIINYGNKKHTTHCVFAYGYGSWTSEQIATCRATGAIMGVSSVNNNTQLQGLTEDVDIIFTEYGFNATMYKCLNEINS